MTIVDSVREYVKEECQNSKYGLEPYIFHIEPMVKYAKDLAILKGCDLELIEVAAWLHDIGSIVEGRKDHHISGAKIATEKLREFNYSEKKIKLVSKCIQNHRGSRNDARETIEEKIIVEADVLSNFDDLAGLFQVAYTYEGLSRTEAKESVKMKLQNKWGQIHFEESRELLRPKYEAAMLLLS
jgi:uncharacterized protein